MKCAAAVVVAVVVLTACARMSPIATGQLPDEGCERFLAALDAATDRAGVRDAGAAAVGGARYLRADRFLASFADDELSSNQIAAWLERLRLVDERARRTEIGNLGSGLASAAKESPYPALSPYDVVRECGRRLLDRDRADAGWVERTKSGVSVPDAYLSLYRAFGLYPIVKWIIEPAVARLHGELRREFARATTLLPHQGEPTRYGPPSGEALTDTDLANLMARVSANALRIPDPAGPDRERLFERFAPVWEIDTVSDADRIGTVAWRDDSRPQVGIKDPAVYRFVTHTRFGGAPLLQLNYQIWFPERPAQSWLDLYAGALDGLVWRVTLSPQGRPIAYDSIHPCGCYYQVFPGLGYRVVQPASDTEPVLSPKPVLPPHPGQRLVIRVSSVRHYIENVSAEDDTAAISRYRWREYEELLALAGPATGRRSLFGSDGLVAHTERLERLLLWPSGLRSPGAMRRSGTQGITLIGRRHFDDAHLLEDLLRPL